MKILRRLLRFLYTGLSFLLEHFFSHEEKGIITLHDLQTMNAHKFEEYVAALFRRNGYQAQVTQKSNDGGVDVVLYKNGKKAIVQCKRYAAHNPVGVSVIREMLGVKKFHKAHQVIVVTTSRFTSGALKEAKRGRVKLIDGEDLVRWIHRGIDPVEY